MNIVLIGYMGSGKSLIGSALASILEFDYIDLDDYIENQEKKTISEIFDDKGEIYFRKQEHTYLKDVLQKNDTVISLGGGTPCFAGNMDLIIEAEKVKSIYLQTSLEELTHRLLSERSKRPLIAHLTNEDDLKDFIRKHLFERSFYYNQSDIKVQTDQKTVETIVTEIRSKLF
ncbi:shikimate kinase [Aquimarina algicola]|uniref:Shikimate kinase n=1 Tax=Aquimarina algicola TaxID=2589995 RepID=A0A504JFP5_9FLAO|nr:shikimate kinase [Aquimarina algicola]TPN85330.1 shikimate kinase [Aquimarina algicola]